MSVLLTDELNVIKWLSQYGALPRRQIINLLNKPKESTSQKIIRNLLVRGEIVEQEAGYFYALDNYQKVNERTVTAVWVLLHYADKVKADAHYRASFPAELYFLMDNQDYEIIVLYEDEEYKLRHLNKSNGTKYIIVVPNLEIAKKLPLLDVPHLFATVNYGCTGEPKINFFKKSTPAPAETKETEKEAEPNEQ